MAVTAAITLSKSTGIVNQQITAVCTVTNTGGSAITVTAAQPSMITTNFATDGLPCAVGTIGIGPGINLTVAASSSPAGNGTLALPFSFVAFAPAPASGTYTIGAQIVTTGGVVTNATTAPILINAISLPDSN